MVTGSTKIYFLFPDRTLQELVAVDTKLLQLHLRADLPISNTNRHDLRVARFVFEGYAEELNKYSQFEHITVNGITIRQRGADGAADKPGRLSELQLGEYVRGGYFRFILPITNEMAGGLIDNSSDFNSLRFQMRYTIGVTPRLHDVYLPRLTPNSAVPEILPFIPPELIIGGVPDSSGPTTVFRPRGAFAVRTAYEVNDVITYNGHLFYVAQPVADTNTATPVDGLTYVLLSADPTPTATETRQGTVEYATETEIDAEAAVAGKRVLSITGVFRAIARKIKNASTTVRGTVLFARDQDVASSETDTSRALQVSSGKKLIERLVPSWARQAEAPTGTGGGGASSEKVTALEQSAVPYVTTWPEFFYSVAAEQVFRVRLHGVDKRDPALADVDKLRISVAGTQLSLIDWTTASTVRIFPITIETSFANNLVSNDSDSCV